MTIFQTGLKFPQGTGKRMLSDNILTNLKFLKQRCVTADISVDGKTNPTRQRAKLRFKGIRFEN